MKDENDRDHPIRGTGKNITGTYFQLLSAIKSLNFFLKTSSMLQGKNWFVYTVYTV